MSCSLKILRPLRAHCLLRLCVPCLLHFRYLGSALAMLFVPYIARDFGPGAQFKASGLLALTWLAIWWRVGSDQPPDGGGSGGIRQASAPALIEEGSMEAVPPFNKKEDPTPLLQPVGRNNSADVGAGGARSPSRRGSCKPDTTAGIPWGVLMQSSAVWAIVTNNFAFHYATYVLMNWLPTYFQSHIGVGLSDMSSWYTVSLLRGHGISEFLPWRYCSPLGPGSFAWRAGGTKWSSVFRSVFFFLNRGVCFCWSHCNIPSFFVTHVEAFYCAPGSDARRFHGSIVPTIGRVQHPACRASRFKFLYVCTMRVIRGPTLLWYTPRVFQWGERQKE